MLDGFPHMLIAIHHISTKHEWGLNSQPRDHRPKFYMPRDPHSDCIDTCIDTSLSIYADTATCLHMCIGLHCTVSCIQLSAMATLATRKKATCNGNLWQDQAFKSCCRRMADLQGEAGILLPCERNCRQLKEAFDLTCTVWRFNLQAPAKSRPQRKAGC